jgi:hypothetical protein
MTHRSIPTLIPIVIAATALIGCSDDPTGPGNGHDPDPYQWPDTADKLMENFERAYTEMDIDEYGNVLHADFEFIFIDHIETWTRAQDMASTANMFAGNPGQNPDGSYREGVQSIAVNTLIRQTPWEEMPGDDPDFPGHERALYQVIIVFTLEGGTNTITIDCDQQFYVTSGEAMDGGQPRTRYYLVGQRDLDSGGKSNEDMTWGSIKSLYSPE